jgi:nucleoside-diphosphate-sugar epimerase
VEKKKVLITGSSGTIGSVLLHGLQGVDITPFDLSDGCDVNNRSQLTAAMVGHDAVVHLAWDVRTENAHQGNFDPKHPQMTINVLDAAVDARVPRVILASSVHADRFAGRFVRNDPPLRPFDPPTPDSPYGASKLHMEAAAKYFASTGALQAICIRFGGVNPDDKPAPKEADVWLSHADCVGLVQACITANDVPNNFSIVYAVSDNPERVHDLTNPFKWAPQPQR